MQVISEHLCFKIYIILPLFYVFFVSAVFKGKRVRGVPINIISRSGASVSERIIQAIRTIPAFGMARHCISRATTQHTARSGRVCNCLIVPANFATSTVTKQRTALTCCCRCTLLDMNNRIHNTFRTILHRLSVTPIMVRTATLNVKRRQITAFLLPIGTDDRPLFGPSLSCSICLDGPFFFVLFRIVVLLAAICIVNNRIGFKAKTR